MNQQQKYDNLYSFLAGEFAESDWEEKSDLEIVSDCITPSLIQWHRKIIAEGKEVLESKSFPWHDIGNYANRHFVTDQGARQWLTEILEQLENSINQIYGNDSVENK